MDFQSKGNHIISYHIISYHIPTPKERKNTSTPRAPLSPSSSFSFLPRQPRLPSAWMNSSGNGYESCKKLTMTSMSSDVTKPPLLEGSTRPDPAGLSGQRGGGGLHSNAQAKEGERVIPPLVVGANAVESGIGYHKGNKKPTTRERGRWRWRSPSPEKHPCLCFIYIYIYIYLNAGGDGSTGPKPGQGCKEEEQHHQRQEEEEEEEKLSHSR